jgi:hypothetical protein
MPKMKGIFESSKRAEVGLGNTTGFFRIRYDEGNIMPSIDEGELVIWNLGNGIGEYYTPASPGVIFDLGDAVGRVGGQSFISGTTSPNSEFRATSIIFKGYRGGADPGNITLNLYLADASGFPTGASIISSVVDGTDVTTNVNGQEIEFIFAETILAASTSYFFKLEVQNNVVDAIRVLGLTEYAGGHMSWNTGGGWIADATDLYFKISGKGKYLLIGMPDGTTQAAILNSIT